MPVQDATQPPIQSRARPKAFTRLLPRPSSFYEWVLSRGETGLLAPFRRKVLRDVSVLVLEIGAGTGASFPHYPAGAKVVATEPNPALLKRAALNEREAKAEIILVRCAAEALPFKDACVDSIVSVAVLCTVEDQACSLAETRRVLRPGGLLHFVEHVRGEGRAGQIHDLITPLWRRLAAGCEPNRRTVEQMTHVGFRLLDLDQRTLPGGFRLLWGNAART